MPNIVVTSNVFTVLSELNAMNSYCPDGTIPVILKLLTLHQALVIYFHFLLIMETYIHSACNKNVEPLSALLIIVLFFNDGSV